MPSKQVLVLGLFVGAVGTSDPNTTHITTMMSDQIRRTMMEIHNLVEAEKFKITKFESAIKRMKTTSSENIFQKTALSKIDDFKRQIERLKAQEKIGEGALKFLEAYSYEVDEEVMTITFGLGQQQAQQNSFFR